MESVRSEERSTRPREKSFIANPELPSQVDAVEWLKENQGRLEKDLDGMVDMGILLRTLELLDENLDLNVRKSKNLLATEYLDQHCRNNNIDPNSMTKGMILYLTERMLKLYGEENPLYHWLQEFLEQSTEENSKIHASLIGAGGFWGVSLETDTASTTNGAAEVQKSLAQLILEIAHNQSKYGTEKVPFLTDPPDASGRQKYVDDADSFIQKAENDDVSWLKKDSQNYELLKDTKNTHTTGALIYNPLFRIFNGKSEYREYDSLENMLVRVFRETEGGKSVEYKDIPASVILTTPPESLEKTLLEQLGEIGEGEWKTLPDLPNLEEEAPIIGISLGGSPNPDSALFRHCRSGQSVVHLHFNQDRGRMDMLFGHASFDGLQGIDWAFAVAEAIGAKEKDTSAGLEIEWQPPTQFGRPMSIENLKQIVKTVENSGSNQEYLDDPEVVNLVYCLGLSDISISNELDPAEYQNIQEAVDAINAEWYKPIREKLEKIFLEDESSGKKVLSKEVKNIILNRLVANKMTVSKFMDMVGRQYYGPETGCMVPRDKRTRLGLIEVKEFPGKLVDLIRTYPTRKEKNKFAKVFDEQALPKKKRKIFMEKIDDTQVDDAYIKKELNNSYKAMVAEYSLTWLHNISELTAIKRLTARFRGVTEFTTLLLNSGIFEGAQFEYMTSHIGDSEKGTKDKSVVWAKIVKFISAMTTMNEDRFSIASSDTKKMRRVKRSPDATEEWKETIRYNDRIRVTTRTLDRLRVSNANVMEPAIERVANELGRGNQEETNRIIMLAKAALHGCAEVREKHGAKNMEDYKVSSLLLITTLMRDKAKGDHDIYDQYVEGIRYLTIAGLLDQQEAFMDTCVSVSKESKKAVIS